MKVYGIEMSKVFDTKEDKSNVFGFDKRSVFGRNNLNLLFGRKEFALNLEKIIKNIDKNENVIAIHSEFGTGKSYFANEFKKYFETEENPHKFIMYNAWKNDYIEKPLGSIASLIKENTRQTAAIKGITNSILEKSWKLGKSITPLVITALLRKYIGLSVEDIIQIKEENIDEVVKNFISEEIRNSDEKRNLVEELKKDLTKLRKRCTKTPNQKIVFIIDELDRCRPNFALELLETIKHIFDVEGYVFLLFLNEKHLNSMISVNYGKDVMSEGYLRKFFDYEFKLPELNLNEYLNEIYGDNFDLQLFKDSENNIRINFCYYIFLNMFKNRYKSISIRQFQYLDKKFRLLLKTFDKEDLYFSKILSFPIYFCFNEIEKIITPELTNSNGQKLLWLNIISKFNLSNSVYLEFSKQKKGSMMSTGSTKSFDEFSLVFAFFINNINSQEETRVEKAIINSINLKIIPAEFSSIEIVKKWCEKKNKFVDYL